MDNTFDIVEKLRKEYLSKIANIIDVLVSKEVNKFVVKNIADIFTQQENPNARGGEMSIDDREHMWYNKFNKWSWNKFENGVIKNG